MKKYILPFQRQVKLFMNKTLLFCLLIPILAFISCKHQPPFSWEYVTCPLPENLHNGFFVDDLYGWIISYGTGVLLKTQDGGNRWQVVAQLDSIYFEDIVFLSREKGWICGEYGTLMYTHDGGISWTGKELADSNTAFYGLDFISENTGILVGQDSKNRSPVIYLTRNGGESWQLTPCPLPLTGGLEHIWFANDNDWFIGGRGHIFVTHDAGETWQACLLNENSVIRGLFMQNKSCGWAVGHEGIIFHTGDGGLSWQQMDRFTQNRLRNIYFINENEGFICGDNNEERGSLWYTSDGGETWECFANDLPDLHRIISSPDYLWIIGKSGQILRLRNN